MTRLVLNLHTAYSDVGGTALVLKKSDFCAKLFLDALFTKVICTFLKSNGFFDTPLDLIKEKKFSSHSRVSSLGRYVFGSEISYNKPPPRLPGLGC